MSKITTPINTNDILITTSEAELKKLGKFNDVRKALQQRLGNRLKFSGRGWKDLWEAMTLIRTLGAMNQNDAYFTSDVTRYIYALTELDGEYRLKELGVQKEHYFNKDKARRWRDAIIKKIAPDVCAHPHASAASAKLHELYQEIAGE